MVEIAQNVNDIAKLNLQEKEENVKFYMDYFLEALEDLITEITITSAPGLFSTFKFSFNLSKEGYLDSKDHFADAKNRMYKSMQIIESIIKPEQTHFSKIAGLVKFWNNSKSLYFVIDSLFKAQNEEEFKVLYHSFVFGDKNRVDLESYCKSFQSKVSNEKLRILREQSKFLLMQDKFHY